MSYLARMRKALVAGAVAGAGAIAKGMVDGQWSTDDTIYTVGAIIVTGFMTWLVPNRVTK